MISLSILTKANRIALKSNIRRGFKGFVQISSEIQDAIKNNKPVVALESTIISHGMPYPRNVQVAQDVENIIRSYGAIPATCAVINGVPKVGLDVYDLEILGNPMSEGRKGMAVMKASRRDLAFACVTKNNAATTVSATMILAHYAGIHIFATGGIGGVHRGAESTMDISADLLELSRTPVTVVCAGIKSILDIQRSLEVLETQGVPVIGLDCEFFPAFFTNDSGIKSPLR
jgi:pseudouridine-5'-phosphate glycosidase